MSSHVTRFENLLEAVPEALVGVDQSGVIRFINHQTESLFGYERGHLIGKPINTLMPEHLWRVYTDHRDDYFSDPRTWSMGLDLELVAWHGDGTQFPVYITLSPIDTGDVLVLVKAAGDVTRRRVALENAQRIAEIVRTSDDAIIAKTPDGVVRSWNPAAERIYGYSSQEMVGRRMDALIPQDRASEMKAILAGIGAGKGVDHLQTIRIRKDGTPIKVQISVSAIRDVDGAVTGASTITHEVTKEMEALAAARAMIESSLDSLVAISPEGLITDVNEATVKVTGVPREELVGTAFSDCFTEPEKANAVYQLVFAKGMAVDYPLTMRHRDGTLTEVLYNASVYRDTTGTVLGVFAAARDVTAVRQAFGAARAMIESSLDSLVAISPEGLITDANGATVKVTGIPREELVGTAFSDCFTEPEKANAIYQLVFAKGMAVDYPLTMRHRDGTLTEVLYNASVYRDTTGNVLGVFAAAREVTTQNRAQRHIAEQRVTGLERLAELEEFQRLTVGRELQLSELKKENERLRSLIPPDGA